MEVVRECIRPLEESELQIDFLPFTTQRGCDAEQFVIRIKVVPNEKTRVYYLKKGTNLFSTYRIS